jgi:hypothetical protein
MQSTSLPVRASTAPLLPGYDRQRDLPRLLPLWPEELADVSLDGRRALVHRLHAVLRRERQRGAAGNWAYDIARHRHLLIAYRAELATWRQVHQQANAAANAAARSVGAPLAPQLISLAASRGPFSSPVSNGLPHSSAPPSDNRGAGSISPGILPAISCNGSANAVSGI